jgi:dTMP kinase
MPMETPTAKFIVLEGSSGSGKSTLNLALTNRLKDLGHNVLSTREPTDNFNRDDENTKSGYSLYELFLKDRIEHVNDEIIPCLKGNITIICDRYIPSTLTYQCIEGVSFEKVFCDNISFPVPDLTVFLDVSFEELTRRISEREETTRFEKLEFRKLEIEQYRIVSQQLHKKGWNVINLINEDVVIEDLVDLIITKL